ncbi:scaffolding protein SbcC-like protein [Salmonella phage 36]|uniref:Scaffolding protein SbcC-like protein n=1 Tax=Salmonella phage 36 TaxID=1654889 RepID=A0A0N7CA28_9CAUD|nr:scaffolding protein SbcC-like protein [Salmonella phage 36]AKJ73994.1 scaffolding protein SbcC-like protein [Salmonella phage 36]
MADYANIIGVQAPGALGDSSLYNIDGCCFTADDHDGVLVGKIVTVKSVTDGYKEITDVFSANTLAYGVAFRTHINTNMDDEGYMIYLPGDPINVISKGRAWVLSQTVDMQPNFGDPVKVGADGFAVKDGFEIAGWHYTGGWQKWNSLFYIVEIQINQSAPYIHAGERKLVRGAVLEPNLPSPQAPNKVVTITVEVAPKDADDKTGSWHVYNDQCEIIPISDTQARLSTKTMAQMMCMLLGLQMTAAALRQ